MGFYVLLISLMGLLGLNLSSFAQDYASGSTIPISDTQHSPIALIKPQETTLHGDKRIDNYAWLKDLNWPNEVKDPETLAYIKAENANFLEVFKPLQGLEEELYQEMLERISENETSYPIKEGEYYYYTSFKQGKEHGFHYRQKSGCKTKEMILDEVELAKGEDFFSFGLTQVNSVHDLLTVSYDTTSLSAYTIRIKNLKTKQFLNDRLEKTAFNSLDIWHQKLFGFFYVGLNENFQSKNVFFHFIGQSQEQDQLVFREEQENYSVNLRVSADKRFAFIETGDTEAQETLAVDLSKEALTSQVIISRTRKTLHTVDYREGYFYISINDQGPEFRLVRTLWEKPIPTNWEEIVPISDNSFLKSFHIYEHCLVTHHREQGCSAIKVRPFNKIDQVESVPFKDLAYEVKIQPTNYRDPFLRLHYSSLLTADTVYEYNFETRKLHTRKVSKASKSFKSEDYQIEKLEASSTDGVQVPITVVYHKDLRKPEGNPLLFYGYGASGTSTNPNFFSPLFSLLDRGFIYAIAHVRGGDELGQKWYLQGKLTNKWNTFEDFLACTEHLIKKGYTAPKMVALMGESAGGNLVGTCINKRPDLYRAAGAFVPFVDVLNDMLDKSQPLTTAFYSEAGNPEEENYYRYIKSYCPYENVRSLDYPNLYVTTGLKDGSVPYWGPLKWVAKLREIKKDNNLIVCNILKEGGHIHPSSLRGKPLCREMSKFYSFLLHVFKR